ncbi:MAG: PAS domain S-box-containing protein [Desulforhopalus sp.]|jgi:PAS domain S-box-containing protein
MTDLAPILLVVDDRADNLFIIEQLVNEYIPLCEVLTAPNADVAFEIAKKRIPDGILSDIQMPGKNGIDLCRQLKEDPGTNHIPVLLVTAHKSNASLRAKGLEAGADDFIARPIDNIELAARIRVMFRIKNVQDELRETKLELEHKVTQRTADLTKANQDLKNEIAERKHAEIITARLASVVEQSNDYIIITDTAGNIEYVNPAFTKMTGYTSAEVLGKNPNLLKSGKHNKNFYKNIWDTIKSGKTWFGDVTNRTKDGVIIVEHAAIFPVFSDQDEIINFAAIKRDITEQRKIEEEKENLELRLQQAQKMEAIGTLAGGIAHDFNNILSVILGYTEMAKEDSAAGSAIEQDLNMVMNASFRAKSLIQQILAFSHQGDTESKQPLQSADLIKEAIKMLRPTLPTTIEINQDIDVTTGLVLADPTKLNQILMNLCTNAYHAMEDTGGKLSISLKETEIFSEDLVHEPEIDAGTFVQLSVSDSGVGIAPEIIQNIYLPYFTTKETGKGTGMGLSIIHGIVKGYGGFVTVSSELGEGTVFNVFLPVVKEDLITAQEFSAQCPKGNERVLFIDDEETLTRMGQYMLESLGYTVTVRHSSAEALETFQNRSDQFDIVITDQTMPGMTGGDLSRRMLQIRPDIPIILCTGHSTIISEEKAKSMGIKEFAFKPLSKNDIAKLIRKVLDVS